MKHRFLRDSAKFLAGLVLGDFLTLWWLAAQGIWPVHFFGIIWSSQIVLPGLLFDAALFLMLVHYGWHVGKIPMFRERTYLVIAGAIFMVVAVVHLIRLFTGDINLNILGWVVPLWISWIGVIVAGYLSYLSFSLAAKLE